MHVLFIHQNFPAQLGHIAAHLVPQRRFRCTFVSQHAHGTVGGIRQRTWNSAGSSTQRRGEERIVMRVVSVNVGRPCEIVWGKKVVRSGIFKEPVAGRRWLRRSNLDGDGQADLSVHGGLEKAVYAYPVENYDYWREQLPDQELPLGIFGENLTLAGLTEDAVYIGDALRIGTARLVVTQPRLPCYKLGIRVGDPAIVARFLASQRQRTATPACSSNAMQ